MRPVGLDEGGELERRTVAWSRKEGWAPAVVGRRPIVLFQLLENALAGIVEAGVARDLVLGVHHAGVVFVEVGGDRGECQTAASRGRHGYGPCVGDRTVTISAEQCLS